jgi:hypothetical protein
VRARILIFPLLAALTFLGVAVPVATAAPDPAANVAASPAAHCNNAATANFGDGEFYTYTGRQLPDVNGVLRFEYQGDLGDWFYSEKWMGNIFYKYCI